MASTAFIDAVDMLALQKSRKDILPLIISPPAMTSGGPETQVRMSRPQESAHSLILGGLQKPRGCGHSPQYQFSVSIFNLVVFIKGPLFQESLNLLFKSTRNLLIISPKDT